jgi:sulfotransferase family protein
MTAARRQGMLAEAPPDRSPDRFEPVFVLAPARSYTSVIATMVGQHPDLGGLPELKLFSYPTVGELEDSLPRFWFERGVTHRSPGLVRALAQVVFGDQSLESLALARQWLQERRHWSGADVFDVLLEQSLPRACVQKSPEDVESDETLQRLASAYPRARYLHLTRHPATTQRSMARHLDTVLQRQSPDRPEDGIGAWFVVHQRILQFASNLPNARYLRVRSEDVLNDRRAQLRAIAIWLGVGSDDAAVDAMLNPAASPFAHPGPEGSGVAGGNDLSFLKDPSPREVALPDTLDPPANWSEDLRVWRMVVDLANRLGYP